MAISALLLARPHKFFFSSRGRSALASPPLVEHPAAGRLAAAFSRAPMPSLDESLYQQHHRVLARIDQLGKGAASRLPPEVVAQLQELGCEADELKAGSIEHELSRD